MNINLFQNFYSEKNLKRKAEIDLCMQKNLDNPHIHYILLDSQNRMTYNDFFKIVNNYTSEDDINIISNLDIYFDDTILKVKKMKKDDVYALCRWDLQKNNTLKFMNRVDSQDSWIFKGNIKPIDGDFPLGICGCDNAIADRIKRVGYNLTNPSKTIKSIHVHTSNIRNYKTSGRQRKLQTVPGPYLTLNPVELF